MRRLERRCRLLLRAYPAAYRRERGDEILATLLEATPAGRGRPVFRDVRALLMGGLRARAAQNRRFTTAVNLRLAVLAGACIYLGASAAGDLDTFANSELDRGVPMVGRIGWPGLLAGLLVGAVVALAWLARRGVVTGTAALAAGAAAGYAGFSSGQTSAYVVSELVCLAAVVALTVGMERPSSAWLCLVGAVVASLLLPGYLQYVTYAWTDVVLAANLGVLVVAAAWVAIDARPLIAIGTYFILSLVPILVDELSWGAGNWFDNPALFVACAIVALAVWRLHRQSLRAVTSRR